MTEFPVFLINLCDSTDRLAAATGALAAQGATFLRIEGFDGRGTDPDNLPDYDGDGAMRYMGRPLNGGEIGCFLGHVRAVQAFADTGAPFGLVLEDDMRPETDALALTRALIDWQQDRGAPDWFVANLGAKRSKITSPVAEIRAGESAATVQRGHYFPMLATALLWTRPGALEFLRDHLPINAPLDNYTRRWLAACDMGLTVDPPLFSTTGAASDIDKSHSADKRGVEGRSGLYGFRKALRIHGDKLRALRHRRRYARSLRKDPQ